MSTTGDRLGAITQLAPQDADFVYSEHERHLSNTAAMYMFDTTNESATVELDDVIEWMRERLGHGAVFTRRLRRVPFELDYPYWVPDRGLDLRRHVFVERADGSGWDALRRQISRIAGSPLDLSRPPWELHFVTGASGLGTMPDRMTVAIVKCHHSAGDGMAVRELGTRLFGRSAAHPPTPTSTEEFSPLTQLARAAMRLPSQWLEFRDGITATTDAGRRVADAVARGEIVEPPKEWPSVVFNGTITPDLAFDMVDLSAAGIAVVRAAFPGVTFNDVVLTTVGGALAAYLDERGETPAGSLSAMVPMSMRGTTPGVADDPAPSRGNHLALMTVDLHTDVGDPADRLQAVHTSGHDEKKRHRHPDVQAASSRMSSSPPWLLALANRARRFTDRPGPTVDGANVMVSNVPWAGSDLVFRDAPCTKVVGILGIVDRMGLRHLVASSGDGAVELSFCTDTAMMPDTERYRILLRQSFDALVTAARTRADE
ncbi:wax ester/triacylglycerol synthase domain-containing protein [Prescottella subtropica]|uniref:wax ester/triacylglycerol synthase domain-containing protein n=1 Tax=Prescottella subtropica TaxID=2545757 RepID=UPI001386D133|nr:wax ester/triacylglycerol synthase domain-containing protein [Prescottella subtropica]